MSAPNLSIFNKPTPNWTALFKQQKSPTKEEANKQKAANRAAWTPRPAKKFSLNNMKYRQRLRNRLEKGNHTTRYGVNWMTRRASPKISPLNPRFTRANKRVNNGESTVGNLTNANLYN
jgi:hypothetical protein